MIVKANDKTYQITEKHHLIKSEGKTFVLCHDDDCNCPLEQGYCPECKITPDTQSKCFLIVEIT